MVVLDDEDDRQIPESDHVQGLEEHTCVGGAVSQITKGDAVFLAVLRSEGESAAEGCVATDDAPTAEEAFLNVVKMHRAALATAEPVLPAHDLGHDLGG